jgi:hypothetical protein
MADPTLAVRSVARKHKDDPRAVVIPREQGIQGWVTDTGREEHTLYSLANSFFDQSNWELSVETFESAKEIVDGYILLTRDVEPYYLYIANRFVEEGYSTDDIAEVVREFYNGEYSRVDDGDALTLLINNALQAREDANIANSSYYDDKMANTIIAYSKIESTENVRRSSGRVKIEYRVEYNSYALTQSALETIIRSIALNERLYYAAYRVTDSRLVRQVREGMTLREVLPTPISRDELLMLITSPGGNDREVVLDVKQSLLRLDDDAYLPLVQQAIPGLTILSVESNLRSVSIGYPLPSLVPHILYYIIRTYEPWKTLMGVDDSQYEKKGVRNLFARVKRWPVPDTSIDNELVVTLHSSYGSNIPVEGELQGGITFEVRDADELTIIRVEELTSRLISDYDKRYNEVLAIYKKRFPSLTTPLTSKGVSKAKQLEILRPDVFGGDYSSRCAKKPVLADKADENAVEFEDLTLKCADRYNLELIEGDPIIPCCVPIVKRAVINMETHMEKNKEGYLFGIAGIFGRQEKGKKGTSAVVRVGEGKTLRRVLGGILEGPNRPLRGSVRSIAPFFQSMWDMTEDEILTYLDSNISVWDSDRLIDGLALNLGFNIFVLELIDDRLVLRVPRHRFAYYIPFSYDRPSIFLYRHNTNPIVYEAVRLAGTREYIQGVETSRRAIEWFQDQHRVELLDRDGRYTSLQDRGPYKEDEMTINHMQIIDAYGKLRGYQERSGLMRYYPHPSAPLLGPYTRRGDSVRNREAYTEVRKDEGEVGGEEWKNMPLGELVALPVSRRWPDDEVTELTWRTATPHTYARLARERSYILQLVNWIYANARRTEGMTLDIFLSLIREEVSVTYDFSTVGEELGEYDFVEAMRYISATGLTEVYEESEIGFILCTKKVRDGLVQMLQVAEDTHGSSPPIPSRIVNIDYDREMKRLDVEGVLHKQIYLQDDQSYQSWRDSIRTDGPLNLSQAYVRLLKSPFTLVSPTHTREMDRWLVQNVANGSYSRSIQCCAIWLRDRRNTGFFTEQAPDEPEVWNDKVVVYTWDESRLLTPNVVVEGRVITILVYPGYKKEGDNVYKGYFAALLPLTAS